MASAPRLDGLRAVIFDFDGVILESADIKTEAFVDLFAAYPEHQGAIRGFHLDNIGISRFVKFEHIRRNILRLPYDEGVRAELGAEFTRLTKARILACPEVPGARALLAALKGRVLRIVASGTPEGELRDIVRERGMDGWFDEVWGTPRTKSEIIRDVLARHGISPERAVMVGDGMSDYKAARETGTLFLAREMAREFDGLDLPKVADMEGMIEWLGLPAGSG